MIRLIAVLFFLPLAFIGQQDFGFWSKAGFQYKINKKISLYSKSELRTKQNASKRNQLYTQLSGKYKITKNLSFSLAYRLKSLNKEYGDVIQNRFHSDINKRFKLDDLSIFFRSRTQYNISHLSNNEWYERLRLKIKYSFNKKLSCFIYDELYLMLNNQEQNSYDKNRFGSGLEYKLNKSLALQLKYLRIKDVNTYNPQVLNIIGVAIDHRLN